MTDVDLLDRVRAYYRQCLAAHGSTPRGVDWNSAESQRLRFAQLGKLLPPERPISLIDYGCGYGALVDFLEESGRSYAYQGFDLLEEMVNTARARCSSNARCGFTSDVSELRPADYVIASGVFNVRQDLADAAWEEYVLETLEEFHRLGGRGFAFNALTVYSDPERRRDYLYYADPGRLFDHCMRSFSRHVSLLHDYGLYEFTILVRKDVTT